MASGALSSQAVDHLCHLVAGEIAQEPTTDGYGSHLMQRRPDGGGLRIVRGSA
ncbi:hypothetical protein BN6_45620 [Saccharothrix espanaensis DSM 44229]|uniref:Uncharacterized protein n=1 Tax=Saccharothrix espanaensis (strain ATCC 51144 / DSM 44229 / JCM 9112 / NBRC 15066 / NRRL 15764) TaxID=1179773 RepID=K0K2M2_SACES|nr:hypothetical protein BN6_45620 [Saccharothrix espanaensis DSM 44229]